MQKILKSYENFAQYGNTLCCNIAGEYSEVAGVEGDRGEGEGGGEEAKKEGGAEKEGGGDSE